MYTHIDNDFVVPGGFNVTITFGPDDDRQPFPFEILEDMIGEGKEVIKLLLTRSGDFDVVRPGRNHTTTIMINDNDLSMLTPYKPEILVKCSAFLASESDPTEDVAVLGLELKGIEKDMSRHWRSW